MVGWMSTFPIKFKSDVWVGCLFDIFVSLEIWLLLVVAKLVAVILDVVVVVS